MQINIKCNIQQIPVDIFVEEDRISYREKECKREKYTENKVTDVTKIESYIE